MSQDNPSNGQAVNADLIPTSPRQRLFATVAFYPTLAWSYLLGRILKIRHWWDEVDSNVIVGAYPFNRDAESLYNEGVRAVVNTCEEYSGPIAEYDRLGIEQFRMPTTDFTHPRLRDVTRAVEFIQSHVVQGHKVYIHCKAGRARSATVALCWLIKYRGLSPADAQAQLLRFRPHINPRLTERQVVKDFVLQTQP